MQTRSANGEEPDTRVHAVLITEDLSLSKDMVLRTRKEGGHGFIISPTNEGFYGLQATKRRRIAKMYSLV